MQLKTIEPFVGKVEDKAYFAEYGNYMSAHNVQKWVKDPNEFWMHQVNKPPVKIQPHFVVGSAIHAAVLEGHDIFRERYSVARPEMLRSDGALFRNARKFLQQCEDRGLDPETIMTQKEWDITLGVTQAVKKHDKAAAWLRGGRRELCFRCDIGQVPFQGKTDWISEDNGLVIDLKTTSNIHDIKRTFYDYGYDRQAAVYQRIVEAVTGIKPEMRFIFVEKQFPFPVMCVRVSQDTIDTAMGWLELHLKRFKYEVQHIAEVFNGDLQAYVDSFEMEM